MASYASSPSCTITSPFPTTSPMVIPSTLSPTNIKLDRSNFPYWKSHILSAVKAHGLEDCFCLVQNSNLMRFVDPGSSSASLCNLEYISWKRLDQFVMSWLLSSISEQMLGHVVHYQYSAEIWSILEQLFSTKSKASPSTPASVTNKKERQ